MERHVVISQRGVRRLCLTPVKTLYTLPDQMRMFLCHDYLPESRDQYQYETSVIRKSIKHSYQYYNKKADFVEMRNRRDATLSMPKLILPAFKSICLQASSLNQKTMVFLLKKFR